MARSGRVWIFFQWRTYFKSDSKRTCTIIADGFKRCRNTPEDIDYINAHATSTQAGDSSEARAMVEVFGEKAVPVSSTKSMTGHECWMAGASEIVYSMIMMQNGFIAPNINFENPDEDSAKLDIVKTCTGKKYKCIFVKFIWLRGNKLFPDCQKMETLTDKPTCYETTSAHY